MTTRRVHVTSLITTVSALGFLLEIMVISGAIKSHFKGSGDEQYLLTRVVISYEINETSLQ